MRPRRTPFSTAVFRLEGGTEDSDLWVEQTHDTTGVPVSRSVWELSDEDRAAIAAGANLALCVWGRSHPAVALTTTDDPIGARAVPAPTMEG